MRRRNGQVYKVITDDQKVTFNCGHGDLMHTLSLSLSVLLPAGDSMAVEIPIQEKVEIPAVYV